jgi:hypothetical protein
MENFNNFKIRIIDFYKDIDDNTIDNICNNNDGKNILELSTLNNISILKKNKKKWKIKSKRNLLTEINYIKKNKIKELTSLFKTNNEMSKIKISNNKLLSELESIDILQKNIQDNDMYQKIKNLTLLTTNKKVYQKAGNNFSDEYIEIYSNVKN